jgi:hypothetical protein
VQVLDTIPSRCCSVCQPSQTITFTQHAFPVQKTKRKVKVEAAIKVQLVAWRKRKSDEMSNIFGEEYIMTTKVLDNIVKQAKTWNSAEEVPTHKEFKEEIFFLVGA